MTPLTGAVCTPLLQWYGEHARALPWRENRDPYRIWVSEIMLQQTRVEAAKAYFLRFMQALPTVQALAVAPEGVYLKLWEGLGYYSRVRNLHRAAQMVCDTFGGSIPRRYEDLLRLPGVGDYTAGAVASIAFGERVPAVDGNVLRVVSRLTADERPVSTPRVRRALRAAVASVLPDDAGTFNQALMELGALICIPGGALKCADCPTAHLCEGRRTGLAPALPHKAAARARTQVARTVFLLCCGDKVALRRRPETGLLAKMWELPGVEETLPPEKARDYLRGRGMQDVKLLALRPVKHIFTHMEWHMTGYYARLRARPPDESLRWVTPAALRETYALPRAFHAFISVLGDKI